MNLYVSSAKTCWATDDAETEVLRTVTVGCIFAIFDAVLRLQGLPLPLPLSQVVAGKVSGGQAYATRLRDFASCQTTFASAVQGSVLMSHPPLLTTRCRLLEYLNWLEEDSWGETKSSKLFAWQNRAPDEFRFNMVMGRHEQEVMGQLMKLEGLEEKEAPTPGGALPLEVKETALDACAAWFIDDWTSNGIYAPEVRTPLQLNSWLHWHALRILRSMVAVDRSHCCAT